MSKPKTVEVTLLKEHTHEGVKHDKGAVIEVQVADLHFLDEHKVIDAQQIAAVGTKKAADEAAAATRRKETEARAEALIAPKSLPAEAPASKKGE